MARLNPARRLAAAGSSGHTRQAPGIAEHTATRAAGTL